MSMTTPLHKRSRKPTESAKHKVLQNHLMECVTLTHCLWRKNNLSKKTFFMEKQSFKESIVKQQKQRECKNIMWGNIQEHGMGYSSLAS